MRDCPRHGAVLHYAIRDGGAVRLRCGRCLGEAVSRRHRRIKEHLVELHGGRCRVCAYRASVYALVFHHVDPSTKSFPMTMASGRSLGAYVEESRKCALVCANCHARIEAGEVDSPPAYGDTATPAAG